MRNIEDIVHEQFKNILKEPAEKVKRLQTQIRKKKTTMCTIRLTKTVLSAYENKRFWVNAYKSYGYGHPDIRHLAGANDCSPLRFDRPDVCKLSDECRTTVGCSEDIDGDCIQEHDDDIVGIDTDCIDDPIVKDSSSATGKKGMKRKLDDVWYNDSKRK